MKKGHMIGARGEGSGREVEKEGSSMRTGTGGVAEGGIQKERCQKKGAGGGIWKAER